MKYFSLGELLLAVPTAILLGVLFSLVYSFIISFCRASIERTALIKKNFFQKIKFRRKNTAEGEKTSALKITAFVACQFVSFMLIAFFAVVYTVFVYMATDGIFRIYILVLVVAAFFLTKKVVMRCFDKISIFVTSLFFELLNKVINLLISVILCVKKAINAVKNRKKDLHIKK